MSFGVVWYGVVFGLENESFRDRYAGTVSELVSYWCRFVLVSLVLVSYMAWKTNVSGITAGTALVLVSFGVVLVTCWCRIVRMASGKSCEGKLLATV